MYEAKKFYKKRSEDRILPGHFHHNSSYVTRIRAQKTKRRGLGERLSILLICLGSRNELNQTIIGKAIKFGICSTIMNNQL